MPIKVNDSTILDDNRNLVDAGIGTFTKALTVGIGQSVVNIDSRASNDNVLSIRNAANNSAFEVTGVGSVGIGISNPSASLHIIGSGLLVSTAVGTSEMFSVSTRAENDNVVSVKNATDGSAFEVTGIGSVGIGISNPSRALHINGSGVLVSAGSTEYFSVETFSSNPNIFEVKTGSSSNAFVVTGLSSVGVGVENPTRALHVSGSGVLVSSGSTEFFSVEAFSSNPNNFEIKGISDNTLFFANNTSVGFGSTSVFTVTPKFDPNYYSLSIGSTEVVGLYSTSITGNIFSVASPQFVVTTSGRVGVGITSPTQKFQVDGNFLVSDSGGSVTVFSAASRVSGNVFSVKKTSSAPAFEITNTGYVGIGTSNPSSLFEVSNSATNKPILSVKDSDGLGNIFQALDQSNNVFFSINPYTYSVGVGSTSVCSIIRRPSSTDTTIGIGTFDVVTLSPNAGNENIFFVTNVGQTLTHFSVNTNGRVGVGTSVASERLHVNGNLLVSDGPNQVLLASTTGSNSLSIVNQSSNPAFDITGTGSVGIGTTQPSSTFQIVSGGSELFSVSSASGNLLEVGTGRTDIVVIDSMGEVGIGTTIPTSKLHVIGDARITGVTTLGLSASTSPTANASMSFELTNDTTLTVRVRGSDGTTRTGTIALS